MNIVSNSVKNGLAAAALVVICSAQVTLAGYQNMMNPTNGPTGTVAGYIGSGSASLGYSATSTNKATTTGNLLNPSAGVSVSGTWTASAPAPFRAVAGSTSQIYVNTALPGGAKVVVYSQAPSGGAGGNGTAEPPPDLSAKLAQDGFVLQPYGCNAGYNVASGVERIDNQLTFVALGTATDGTAHWLRVFVLHGAPNSRDDVIKFGIKIIDILLVNNFNFGDYNSPDRCNALKLPINLPSGYTEQELWVLEDGGSVSDSTVQIVNCPDVTLTPCNPSYPTNSFTTSGGCGAITVTFDTDPNSILPGNSAQVTATATDASGNIATCTFTATRTGFQITDCPTTIYALTACTPTYPTLHTSGGCPPIGNIVFNPASASSIAPGTLAAPVTATVTDHNGTVATCQFTVSRPALTFVNCPTSPWVIGCNGTLAYPSLTTSGGCAPVNITFNPASASSLPPGNTLVTATATDANNSTATCHFTVSRPFLTLGSSGFAPPIGGTGGTCAAPIGGNFNGKVQIKFNTYLCNTLFVSTTPPPVTITQLDSNCNPTGVVISGPQLVYTSNAWHGQWVPSPTQHGYFLITVNLGDGNPNPIFAIIQIP
jgi:hypothetical protein